MGVGDYFVVLARERGRHLDARLVDLFFACREEVEQIQRRHHATDPAPLISS